MVIEQIQNFPRKMQPNVQNTANTAVTVTPKLEENFKTKADVMKELQNKRKAKAEW
jgi:hypothetical protein